MKKLNITKTHTFAKSMSQYWLFKDIKNTRCLMCSPVSRLRLIGTARFTVKAKRSDETEEGGAVKYCMAIFDKTGDKLINLRILSKTFSVFALLTYWLVQVMLSISWH